MNMHPARRGTIYAPSDTHTAQIFDLAHYRRSSPAPQTDALANQFARLFTLSRNESSLAFVSSNRTGMDMAARSQVPRRLRMRRLACRSCID